MLIHANQSRAGKAVSIARLSKRADAGVVTFVQTGYDRNDDLDRRYLGRTSVVDIADVAVHLGGEDGDAALPVPRSTSKMCPISGTVGVAAAWAMIAFAAEILAGRGKPPQRAGLITCLNPLRVTELQPLAVAHRFGGS